MTSPNTVSNADGIVNKVDFTNSSGNGAGSSALVQVQWVKPANSKYQFSQNDYNVYVQQSANAPQLLNNLVSACMVLGASVLTS